MMTAEQELGLVRPQLVDAVEHLMRDGRSRMDAYDALGRKLGKSARWVRRVIGRDEAVVVRLRDALNIAAAYDRLCARVAAAADAIEAENEELRRELDAALLRRDRAVLARTGETPAHQAPAARGPTRAARSALADPAVQPNAVVPRVDDLPLWRAMKED